MQWIQKKKKCKNLQPNILQSWRKNENTHDKFYDKKSVFCRKIQFWFTKYLCKKRAGKHWLLKWKFVFRLFRQNGPDGNRTRVQKSIPCSSTSVVYYFTFPPRNLNKHNSRFSSFMIRPHTQSLICVVSHVVEAWLLKRGCSRSDCCP